MYTGEHGHSAHPPGGAGYIPKRVCRNSRLHSCRDAIAGNCRTPAIPARKNRLCPSSFPYTMPYYISPLKKSAIWYGIPSCISPSEKPPEHGPERARHAIPRKTDRSLWEKSPGKPFFKKYRAFMSPAAMKRSSLFLLPLPPVPCLLSKMPLAEPDASSVRINHRLWQKTLKSVPQVSGNIIAPAPVSYRCSGAETFPAASHVARCHNPSSTP